MDHSSQNITDIHQTKKLRVLDLFSGIGGFSLGLERTGGFETVAFCEIEEFPRKVLAKHWPEVPQYEDVKQLTGDILKRDGISVDVITGGFPCQDISVAGNQAGIGSETRSGLWSEIVRLIGELRPQYVILENVSNLLRGPSEKPGGWFGRILSDLAQCGYDAEWQNISAAAVNAPHKRERVWIVAYPKRNQQPRKKPCFWKAGRVGWQQQPFSWAVDWQDTLSKFRRLDDGFPRSVASTDGYRNAVVPQIPELIGRAILAAEMKG